MGAASHLSSPLPQRPRLPRDYLVGAVATNPTPDLTPHCVRERARGPSPAGLETRLQRAAASCHPMPNPRAFGMRGQFCVCVQLQLQQPCDTDNLTVTADTFHACLTRAWG